MGAILAGSRIEERGLRIEESEARSGGLRRAKRGVED